VVINAFVGGMVGLERTLLPQIAEAEFAIAAKTAILSFIVAFGIAKALTNFFSGVWANKFGRKKLLVTGWLFGLPVPFILMYTQDWNGILVANILLGINQGLTWSSTVLMKIDLVGGKKRGFAMGLNEFAGYVAVAITAFFTGWIASHYGLRPYPFYIGIGLVAVGIFTSAFLVRDTRSHMNKETEESDTPRLINVFRETSFSNRNLGSVTQAGLVNNLNDGMVWGLLPILLAAKSFSITDIGVICAIYPAVWGIGQLFTGKMSDFFCKKSMLSWGMFLQGLSILLMPFAQTFGQFSILSAILGWGTAMVYPTFLAIVADNTHPHDRATSLGVFRLWRDLGYAIGAILTGVVADVFGVNASVITIATITILSALFVERRMRCRINAVTILDWIFRKSVTNNEPGKNYNPCGTS
jgi:MFS family permease